MAIPVIPSLAAQQTTIISPDHANMFALDFAVPSSPAFDLIKVDASKILRPTTVRELGGLFSNLVGDGTSITVPKELGLEIAPVLLAAGRTLDRQTYAARPWLYRLRISGAVSRPTGGNVATNIALGVRVTVFDDADLRTRSDYFRLIESLQLDRLTAMDGIDAALAADTGPLASITDRITRVEMAGLITDVAGDIFRAPHLADSILGTRDVPEALRSAVLDVVNRFRPEITAQRNRLERARDSIQNTLWNANSLDFALAGRAEGDDATASKIQAAEWAAWVTWAVRASSWGQLLIGGRGSVGRDSVQNDWDGRGILSARLYVGTNYAKFFVETQGEFMEDVNPTWLLNSGGEFKPGFGGWFNFSAGWRNDRELGDTRLVTNFSFNFALPNFVP